MIEIERVFLIKSLPKNLKKYPHDKVLQAYLVDKKGSIRIRHQSGHYDITKKTNIVPGDKTIRKEIEIPITKKEFQKIAQVSAKSLSKIRYYIPLKNKLTAEINIYKKELQGLVLVEVEFKNKKQCKDFVPPDWFGKEITQHYYSRNSFMAGKDFKDIKKYYS